MKQIIAATDFSTRSQLALRRAGLLARQLQAELTLAHVVDSDLPEQLAALQRHEAERIMAEQIEALAELRGVRCRPEVIIGDVFDGILQAAAAAAADLIVMGTHRRQLLRDIFVGTTIERVIRTGSRPVLLVNSAAEGPYRNVIAAVDVSEPSAHAIRTAGSLGLIEQARFTVVHAFVALGKSKLHTTAVAPNSIGGYVAGERYRAQVGLSTFLATSGLRDDGWSYRLEEGEAPDVVAGVVHEAKPDLVVIGTRGRSGLGKMLLGSVAEQLLRRLEADVLAVPPALPAEASADEQQKPA